MSKDRFGYTGRLLRISLGTETITIDEPHDFYYQHYLGGRGIIIHTLLTEVPPHTDPLSPDNKLIFATGPLTGQKFMGSGKSAVGAKSPLTGAYGESMGGGMWGVELKRAKYDAVIIEGKAKHPVYVWIRNGKVEIKDASEIWGSEVKETTAWLREVTGEGRCSCAVIGPSGEQQVNFASIIADCNHAFGRCGMGAVMGSKNLKAIAVKGNKLPLAAEKEKLKPLNLSLKSKSVHHPFRKYGTGCRMRKLEEVGNLPIRNHSGGRFPNVHKIDAVALMNRYGIGTEGCFNCPVRCKKKIRIEEAPWPIAPAFGGPEYETLASFGSNLLIDDLEAICKAHEMCNRFGIDSISTGATIAFAMECFENGILTLKDTNDIPLYFGNAEGMLQMVEMIGRRKGIGDLLADGSKRAAEAIGKGSAELAMQVKGLEVPYHEPRYKQGIGLRYSVHPTGANHATGVMDDMLPLLLEDWESLNVSEMIPPTELSSRKVRM
ncbi:MAG: aldehyde ferredoxin oxidoreductase, partial [Deltaproteobacteria bacterium]|nr:aldehyde ferredoxin oxidoreductase [Deltaproteobacteria bacterium]